MLIPQLLLLLFAVSGIAFETNKTFTNPDCEGNCLHDALQNLVADIVNNLNKVNIVLIAKTQD